MFKSVEKSAQTKHHFKIKPLYTNICVDVWKWETTRDGGSVIMDYGHFSRKQQFEVKNILMMDLFLTNTQIFSSKDVN